jgi:hypothetical protein
MKPDWDKVMQEINGEGPILVADVDCTTAAGKPFCTSKGVKSFPSIKYGDPFDLKDYAGKRDFASLKKFASELKPSCSPFHLESCSEDQASLIKEIQDMSSADLDSAIKKKKGEIKMAEEIFAYTQRKLQMMLKAISMDKNHNIETVKKSGLQYMQAVKSARDAESRDEL